MGDKTDKPSKVDAQASNSVGASRKGSDISDVSQAQQSKPLPGAKESGAAPVHDTTGGGDEAPPPNATKTTNVRTKNARARDSSDEDDDDDGFRVVVGRESTPGPTGPTKKFLRGTNTLVNTNASGGETKNASNVRSTSAKSAGTTDSNSSGSGGGGGGGSAIKSTSAAASIASLVPSKGATVARPVLKPGQYPPTAELQHATGKTAFDTDIDGMEEQPWRHPGVDIADFFNYGFTEESWRVYCEKQLRNRYDLTQGRLKPGGSAGSGGNQARHGGGVGARRGGERQNTVGRHNFGPQGTGQGRQGEPWTQSGNAGPRHFPQQSGMRTNVPPNMTPGGTRPPWFDGPPPQGFRNGGQNFGSGRGEGAPAGPGIEHWNGHR